MIIQSLWQWIKESVQIFTDIPENPTFGTVSLLKSAYAFFGSTGNYFRLRPMLRNRIQHPKLAMTHP